MTLHRKNKSKQLSLSSGRVSEPIYSPFEIFFFFLFYSLNLFPIVLSAPPQIIPKIKFILFVNYANRISFYLFSFYLLFFFGSPTARILFVSFFFVKFAAVSHFFPRCTLLGTLNKATATDDDEKFTECALTTVNHGAYSSGIQYISYQNGKAENAMHMALASMPSRAACSRCR